MVGGHGDEENAKTHPSLRVGFATGPFAIGALFRLLSQGQPEIGRRKRDHNGGRPVPACGQCFGDAFWCISGAPRTTTTRQGSPR